MLANDPHLGLSAPAIWYFAHLQSPEGRASDGSSLPALNVTGATLPGMPFVVLGRTAEVAWGFTNTNPDVQDLYLEQINPADSSQYRTPTGWEKFGTREEVFKVKGQADVKVTLRSTRHGPVLSDAQAQYGKVLDTTRYALALRWAALDTDNRTVEAGLRANGAHTVQQLLEAFSIYHSPMQSIVAADVQGHIGFKAAARCRCVRLTTICAAWHPRRAGMHAMTGRAGWTMSRHRRTTVVHAASSPQPTSA